MGLAPARDGEMTFRAARQCPGLGRPPRPRGGRADGDRGVPPHLRPADAERIHDWVGKGLGAKRPAVTRWLGRLEERLETVTIEGDEVLVLREDVDDLRTASPSTAVRLLPGRDPWVMGPGTSDTRVVPPARRELVSRTAPMVVARGVLAGTWTVREERLQVRWFHESGRVPRAALDAEAARLSAFLQRPLDLSVDTS